MFLPKRPGTPWLPRPLLVRLAIVGAGVVLTIVSFDTVLRSQARINLGNACGADAVRVAGQDSNLVEITYGAQETGSLPLYSASLSTAGKTKDLVGPGSTAWFRDTHPGPETVGVAGAEQAVRYRMSSPAGALRQATYEARVGGAVNTVHASVQVRAAAGAAVSEAGLPVLVDGFDLYLPGGRRLRDDRISQQNVQTRENWVILASTKCKIVAWAPGLTRISTSWRFGNVTFFPRIGSDGRATLNLKYLYGATLSRVRGHLNVTVPGFSGPAANLVQRIEQGR